MKSTRNAPGPKRSPPPCPPIDPALVYPIRRLADWSIGGRGRAALVKAGLRVLQFGKLKFVEGAELIRVLKAGGALHPQSVARTHLVQQETNDNAACVANAVAKGGRGHE